MPPYDPYAEQDQQQQMQMQNALRQRMQAMGGVNPMNFNPQAQGAMGFAPSAPQDFRMQAGNVAQQFGGGDMGMAGGMGGQQMQMEPPPESVAPQVPAYMQAQRNRMMQQRANVNRGMMQAPPTAQGAAPGMAPGLEGYNKSGGAPQDFMAMRGAADAARNAAMPGKPMGRVAAGLGAANSAMGQANQMRNQVKKKAVQGRTAAKDAGGQLSQPPTF